MCAIFRPSPQIFQEQWLEDMRSEGKVQREAAWAPDAHLEETHPEIRNTHFRRYLKDKPCSSLSHSTFCVTEAQFTLMNSGPQPIRTEVSCSTLLIVGGK